MGTKPDFADLGDDDKGRNFVQEQLQTKRKRKKTSHDFGAKEIELRKIVLKR